MEEEGTTNALIRGVLVKMRMNGHNIGGFQAYVTSDVLIGAGLSSSAAFETLIGTILSYRQQYSFYRTERNWDCIYESPGGCRSL